MYQNQKRNGMLTLYFYADIISINLYIELQSVSRNLLGGKMKSLNVIPHVGIGLLKLGMSPDEILVNITQMHSEWAFPNQSKICVSEYDGGYYINKRYMDHSFFFMVCYENDQATEICVDYQLREHLIITLYDMDVFKIPAEQMVTSLKQISPVTYDSDDEQLSFEYEFSDIGIRLWRELPFHPKLLSDKEYMKDMGHMIDEMTHYLYFEMIGVSK